MQAQISCEWPWSYSQKYLTRRAGTPRSMATKFPFCAPIISSVHLEVPANKHIIEFGLFQTYVVGNKVSMASGFVLADWCWGTVGMSQIRSKIRQRPDVSSRMSLTNHIAQEFYNRFPGTAPLVMAPAASTLIGEHVDTTEGFCMPAIDKHFVFAMTPAATRSVISSPSIMMKAFFPFTTSIPVRWINYLGVLDGFGRRGFTRRSGFVVGRQCARWCRHGFFAAFAAVLPLDLITSTTTNRSA